MNGFSCINLFIIYCSEYEAMECYIAQSEDEIALSVGEKVTVVYKSMDGWWKIR